MLHSSLHGWDGEPDLDTTADRLSSLLSDPEAMQRIAGIASELMGGSPMQQQAAPDPVPASAPAASMPQRTQTNPARRQLLDALRPFLSSDTCARIDHAERILSMAQMAKTAVQMESGGKKEV